MIIERSKNAGAIALYCVFIAAVFLDLLVPSVATKPISPDPTADDPAEAVRRVSEADLELLNSDAWYDLSSERKSELLLAVMTEMSDEMGILTPALYLETDASNNEAGFYSDRDNSIHVWKPFLDHVSAAEATDMILHELFHSYQHSILQSSAINWDSPDIQTNAFFAQIWQWKQDNSAYIPSDRWDETFADYYGQSLEEDARAFARRFVPRFIDTEAE